ncbi:MAG: RNA polymerase sigma factor [Planctomycetota bacterium]
MPELNDLDESDFLGNELSIRALALALLRNPHDADDVVQEAYLAAHQKGGIATAPLPWLMRVVRNLAARVHRDRGRRQRRELRSAVAVDAATPAHDSAAMRLELHQKLIQAILSLKEPYRDTVLSHYVDGEPVKDIAERQSIPHRTVRTRLARGLEQLRHRLGKPDGHAWGVLVGVYGGSCGLREAVTAGTNRVGETASAPQLYQTVLKGGSLMSTQSLCIAGAVVVLCTAAFFVGRQPGEQAPSSANADREGAPPVDHLQEAVLDLRAENERLRGDNERLRTEARVAAEVVAAPQVSGGDAVDGAPEPSSLMVEFGSLQAEAVFRDANWQKLAVAALAVTDIWNEYEGEREQSGVTILRPEDERRLLEVNEALVSFSSKLVGKVRTHAPVNGEFTHPLAVANLIAAALASHEIPLDDSQLAEIEKLGSYYETESADLARRYDDSTLLLEQLIGEVRLKEDFVRGLRGELTAEQRAVVFPPGVVGRLRRDIFSPLLTTMFSVTPLHATNVAELQSAYVALITDGFELDDAQLRRLAPAIDQYVQNVRPDFESDADPQATPGYAHVMSAAQAHLEVLWRILDLPGLSDESGRRVADSFRWPIPRRKQDS